jgi:hypothetical protein
MAKLARRAAILDASLPALTVTEPALEDEHQDEEE